MSHFETTFAYKLIYVFRINDKNHQGLLKVGDATIETTKPIAELVPNCRDLNIAAKKRIDSYTRTASIEYELLHTELAVHLKEKHGVKSLKAFRDKAVHSVLVRSGIQKHEFNMDNQGVEWFKTDLATVKNAIAAVKRNQSSLDPRDISTDNSPIIFRPEQKQAIKETVAQFKNSNRMLWNAKMRFGKTLTALQVAKEMEFKRTLIFTHRPVVNEGWFEDFHKIFGGTNYKFGSKTHGEPIEKLVDSSNPFVYFASIQDLRGSAAVGGKFEKNEFIFLIDWDYIIVDEAHEGTQTTLGQKVFEEILNNTAKTPKMLELSGTPFNLLADFGQNEIFTWDYVMEQRAKADWPLHHFGDSNPYEELPKLEIFTYNLDKFMPGYIDVADSAFNFREFFKTWTGDVKKDYKQMPDNVRVGDFMHADDVWKFLNLITKADSKTNFPFSTEENRSFFRHTLWMVPGVKEAKALSKMLKAHPIFSTFKIANVAGDGDEEESYKDALKEVRSVIGTNPDDHYSITISCGRLTTGVTVPEWTGVLMLAGTFSTSAANYLQTIFRVQTPANINGRMKERCGVFDFAPDRTLKMVAEAGHLSSKAGKIPDKVVMGEFLNYCPVIAMEGSNMNYYNPDILLQQLKKAYTDRVVKNGFDDKHIYNENLLKLDDIQLQEFEALKKIVGTSKQTEKVREIDINTQGFTKEEYEELERIERKPKRELTEQELALLEEKKKKKDNAQKAMSILRGISIRIPLLIYGADVPVNKEIEVKNFVDIIDDASWNEFMPTGVTKEVYSKFAKYYDTDVFVAAGRRIRDMVLAADKLSPTERVVKIAEQFAMFKNPDKETVLTPWRVVNMHLGDCLGGYNFYNEDYTMPIEEPRLINHGKATTDTLTNKNAKILEINSKTGLYPLYVTYSLYRTKLDALSKEQQTLEKQLELWNEVVENNLFVICKTPMARSITKRTLLGYRKGKINAHAFDDLIMQLRDKPEQFREKVSRGNFWNKEERVMKFDAIVGNPPYQIKASQNEEQQNAISIYNEFVTSAKKLNPSYISMIMPSRWMTGGRGMDSFREEMLNDTKISLLFDYIDCRDVFPSVEIKGGVCYFLRDYKHSDKCKYVLKEKDETTINYRYLNDMNIGMFVRDNHALNIINKVITSKDFESFESIAGSQTPFGIVTSFKDYTNSPDAKNNMKIYGNKFVGYTSLNNVTKNKELAYKYKVFAPKAVGNGILGQDKINPIVPDNPSICTQTYIIYGNFETKQEAENLCAYMKTNFFHFLLGQLKNTQQMAPALFKFVPLLNFKEKWTDEKLFAKYNLNQSEVEYINSKFKK